MSDTSNMLKKILMCTGTWEYKDADMTDAFSVKYQFSALICFLTNPTSPLAMLGHASLFHITVCRISISLLLSVVRPHGSKCHWVKGRPKILEGGVMGKEGEEESEKEGQTESRLHICCCHGNLCRRAF